MSDAGSQGRGVRAAVVQESMATALERVDAVTAEVVVLEPGRDGGAVTSRHVVSYVGPGLWRIDVDGRRRLVVTGRRQVVEAEEGVLTSYPTGDEAWAAARIPRGGVLGWGTAFLGGVGADVETLAVVEDHDVDLDRPIWRVRAVVPGAKDHVYDVSVDRETGLALGFRALGTPYQVRTVRIDLSTDAVPDDLFVLDERRIVSAPVPRRHERMGGARPATHVRFDAASSPALAPGAQALVLDTLSRPEPGGITVAVLSALAGGAASGAGVDAIWPTCERYAATHPGTQVTLVWAGFQREMAARPQECLEVLLALTDAVRGMRRSLDADLVLTP